MLFCPFLSGVCFPASQEISDCIDTSNTWKDKSSIINRSIVLINFSASPAKHIFASFFFSKAKCTSNPFSAYFYATLYKFAKVSTFDWGRWAVKFFIKLFWTKATWVHLKSLRRDFNQKYFSIALENHSIKYDWARTQLGRITTSLNPNSE